MLSDAIVRKLWFLEIQNNLKTYRHIFINELSSIEKNNYTSDVRMVIITDGICLLGELTTQLVLKESDESFDCENYDLSDRENTLLKLTRDLLSPESAKELFAAVMECEISLRNKHMNLDKKDLEDAINKLNLEQELEKCCCSIDCGGPYKAWF